MNNYLDVAVPDQPHCRQRVMLPLAVCAHLGERTGELRAGT